MNDIISSESWFDFVISNYKQIFLLIIVGLVIYCVEYLTHFNARFFTMPIIPGVTNISSISIKKPKKIKN
jgi:hypothetical protein